MQTYATAPKSCSIFRIKDELGANHAQFYDQGLAIGKKVNCSLEKGEQVEISFVGMPEPNFPFLSGLFGLIFHQYSVETVKNLLHLSHATADVKADIEDVRWRADNIEFHNEVLYSEKE